MIGRVSAYLVVAVVGGAFIAGCGGSSSSTPTGKSVSTAATPPPAAAGTASTSATTTPGGATSGAGALSVQQTAAICQEIVRAAPTLSAAAKAKVEGICAKAASGDLAGARQASKEVCAEVVNSTSMPPGPAKEQALAACQGHVTEAAK